MATINRKNNRKNLYQLIDSEFTNSNGTILKFEDFESIFFSTEEKCVSSKPFPADKNGYVKQGNLFDILTKKNKKGKIIKDEFIDPNSTEFISLKDKVTFVRTYACFDFPWTTTSSTNYCSGALQSTVDASTGGSTVMNDYVGIYDIEKNDDIPVTIVDVNDDLISLDVSFPGIENNPVYKKFSKINLKPKSSGSNVFDVYVDDKQIPSSDVTFSSDKSKFTFNIIKFKGVAIKTKDDPTPPPSPKSDDSKKSKTNTTNTDNTKKDSGKTIINKTVYNYNGVDDNTDFGTIQSSDNKECKDFPFTLGCINDYIGDINEKIFGVGKRRANVFSTPLLKQLQSYGYLVPNDKDPKITEDIYNRIMKSSTKDVIKESVKKVLKEYINKKK
jgi:hypothetical protein